MSGLMELLATAVGAGYRIERELGGGGMSHVFLAEEVALGRRVVIKVLPPEMAATVNADRFRREIQLAAQLQHPAIVPLLTAGSSPDLLWYAMPFVEGESLRAKIARVGPLPMDEAVRAWRDLLEALEYAHEHAVVHRDIKPDNIMMSGRHAVAMDFGVAKAVSAATGTGLPAATQAGLAIGTPAYMSPEQAAGDTNIDGRTDLYAAGLVMYEMLAEEEAVVAAEDDHRLVEDLERVERRDDPAEALVHAEDHLGAPVHGVTGCSCSGRVRFVPVSRGAGESRARARRIAGFPSRSAATSARDSRRG